MTSRAHCPSRRRFLTIGTTAFASVAAIAGPAPAAQFEFKCANQYPADHPTTVRLTQLFESVERESGGRIRAQFFSNSVLGTDAAMLSQLRVGAIHFLSLGANLSAVVPPSDISSLGYAYENDEEALRVFDGALGEFVRKEALTRGLAMLHTTWNNSFRQIGSNTHPIRVPDDLHGFKIKVLGRISIDLYKELGAEPLQLSLNDTYTGLQTHLVDGEDAPLITIETSRLFENNKYISLTNHSWSGLWLVANADAWKRLPPDLQEIFERNNHKFALLGRRDVKLLTAAVANKLARQGLTINHAEQAPFRNRLRPYYDRWASEFGATEWSILQGSVAHKLS